MTSVPVRGRKFGQRHRHTQEKGQTDVETGAMHVQAKEPSEAGREALRDFSAGPPRGYVRPNYLL